MTTGNESNFFLPLTGCMIWVRVSMPIGLNDPGMLTVKLCSMASFSGSSASSTFSTCFCKDEYANEENDVFLSYSRDFDLR